MQAELDAAVLAYESRHIAPALAAFESLAGRGVPAAEYNLAVMHLRGEVPQPDPALAQALLTRAARSGFVTAQLALPSG